MQSRGPGTPSLAQPWNAPAPGGPAGLAFANRHSQHRWKNAARAVKLRGLAANARVACFCFSKRLVAACPASLWVRAMSCVGVRENTGLICTDAPCRAWSGVTLMASIGPRGRGGASGARQCSVTRCIQRHASPRPRSRQRRQYDHSNAIQWARLGNKARADGDGANVAAARASVTSIPRGLSFLSNQATQSAKLAVTWTSR